MLLPVGGDYRLAENDYLPAEGETKSGKGGGRNLNRNRKEEEA